MHCVNHLELTDEEREQLKEEYGIEVEMIDAVDDLEPSDTMGRFAAVSDFGDLVPPKTRNITIEEFLESSYSELVDHLNGLEGSALECIVNDAERARS